MTSPVETVRPPKRVGPTPADLTERGQQLLDEIEAIVFAEGFAHLTIGDLADKVQCSRTTLYTLAPSKDELILAVVDRRMHRFGRAILEEVNRAPLPLKRLQAFLSAGHSADLRKIGHQFSRDLARQPAVRLLVTEHMRYSLSVLTRIIQEGIDSGDFKATHARVVAESIDAAWTRLLDPEVLGEAGVSFSEATAELMQVWCQGLTAGPVKLSK